MSLTINTNVSSLYAQQYLGQNQIESSKTMQRLSSGFRINNASDDPAGLAIAESMQASVNGLIQGSRNGNDGINLVQTAQGAMQQILTNLQRMNSLAVQAANGTNGVTDMADLDTEYQTLLSEISRVASATNFNNVNLLQGGTIDIQIGAGSAAINQVTINLTDSTTGVTGLSLDTTQLYDGTTTAKVDAKAAIDALKIAITSVTTGLAELGASQSGLEAAIQSNDTFSTNLQAAKSAILDTDYAAESSNLAKYNVLNQSSVAMLSQANSAPQLVLQLLRQ